MSIATYRIKNVWLRRLALVVGVICIPFLLLLELGKVNISFLGEAGRELMGLPGTIRRQWRRDYR
jgi:formate hydrogenlyase subunit 4